MSTVTIGSDDYTVYSDVSEAGIYFNGSTQFLEWDAFTTDQQGRGLISATRLIDRQKWQGEKVVSSPEQELEFGRTGLSDCSGSGATLTAAETLATATEASQLLALQILSGSTVEVSQTTEDLTKRLKAGSVEIENFRANVGTNTRFPTNVMELIGCFLASNVTIAGALSSGTDGVALNDDFSFNRGF